MSTMNVQPPKKILKSYSITHSEDEDDISRNEQASSVDLETEFAWTNDTIAYENLTKIRPKWIENSEVADDVTFKFTDDDILAEMLTELDDTVWPPTVLNSARINEWRNAEDWEEDLFDAIRDGNYEVVKNQVDEDIEKVNMADGEMLTLLHWSVVEGQKNICEYLLENGAKVDMKDNSGFTPLHYACKCRHTNLVELLLKWSANVLAATNEHKLPKDLTEDQYIRSLLDGSRMILNIV